VNLLLNILWFVLCGFSAGLSWLLGALLLAVSIVGLPWAPAAFRIGLLAFAPFGREAVPKTLAQGSPDGCLGGPLNVVWFVLAGWYIALAHVIVGLALAITLIGIPFALQHLKLAALALAPVGKTLRP
jgi:uncharacterized membrane protein YccF (DUF307 family)